MEFQIKKDEPFVLWEGDYKRFCLMFSEFKGNMYMKIMEQWRNDEADENWKFNKRQITMGTEQAIDVLTKLKVILGLKDILINIEEFMVNNVEVTYAEEELIEKGG